MDGMLSQDEINALLSGMDLSGGDAGGATQPSASPVSAAFASTNQILTPEECDAIGEIANISMGSSATTLYSLVNRKVNITTPVVALTSWDSLIEDYERPCVFIQIRYTTGLEGTNIMVLKESDVKIITDLMMGGAGSNTTGELGELHLSAISEAMNQMMGSSATSLSTMLGKMIDISPPEASLIDLNAFDDGGKIDPFLKETFVKISFRMQIDDLVDSTIMQLYPVEFARTLYETFITSQMTTEEPEKPVAEPLPYIPPTVTPDAGYGQTGAGMNQMSMQPGMNQMGMQSGMTGMGMNNMGINGMSMQPGMSQMGMNTMGMNGMNMQPGMNAMGMNGMNMQPGMNTMGNGMNIQNAQFQNFSSDYSAVPGRENIGLIMDVPLEVTVELGRTSKSISDILDFAPGTIIELNKIAGEPIDVLVNGKFVARGEVVVIEENFGVRVTEIIK